MTAAETDWKPAKNWPLFIVLTVLVIWLAHALAFFAHEYAHSFTAWILGWKTNPLALNYGHLDTANLLAQFEIDENVDYSPIFSSGNYLQVGIIAGAGMVIGNALITYPASRWGYWFAKQKSNRGLAFFFYWLCVASIGNLIDYVPVRTFASTGDMDTLAKGFNCSPVVIVVVLGIPFQIILWHFFFRFSPRAIRYLFPGSKVMRIITAVLTALLMFGFYGAAGLTGADPVSQILSYISIYGLLPLTIAVTCWLMERKRKVKIS